MSLVRSRRGGPTHVNRPNENYVLLPKSREFGPVPLVPLQFDDRVERIARERVGTEREIGHVEPRAPSWRANKKAPEGGLVVSAENTNDK